MTSDALAPGGPLVGLADGAAASLLVGASCLAQRKPSAWSRWPIAGRQFSCTGLQPAVDPLATDRTQLSAVADKLGSRRGSGSDGTAARAGADTGHDGAGDLAP
jgi:hypothetical protein